MDLMIGWCLDDEKHDIKVKKNVTSTFADFQLRWSVHQAIILAIISNNPKRKQPILPHRIKPPRYSIYQKKPTPIDEQTARPFKKPLSPSLRPSHPANLPSIPKPPMDLNSPSPNLDIDISQLSEADKRELGEAVNNEMQKAKIQECFFPHPPPPFSLLLPPYPRLPNSQLTHKNSGTQPDGHMFYEMRDEQNLEWEVGSSGGDVRAELRGEVFGCEYGGD